MQVRVLPGSFLMDQRKRKMEELLLWLHAYRSMSMSGFLPERVCLLPLIFKTLTISCDAVISWAHGVVVSHPLSMREALGSIPSVSMPNAGEEELNPCMSPCPVR